MRYDLTEIEQNLVKSGSLFEAEQIILKGVLELGQVMGSVMPKVQGQADGKLVNQVVKEQLSK